MRKKLSKYIFCSILLAFSLSCSEEFLELKPIGEQNSGTFYITQQAGEQAVIAAYSQYNNVSLDKELIMAVDVVSDDAEAGGEYVNEVPSYENFNRMTPLTTDGEIRNVYGSLYKSIYFANIALERLPEIIEIDDEADPAVINRLIGECKFLRALGYSYLVRYFGGVPLVDHVLGADEYFMPRAELIDLYNLIEQDLIDAIAVLPERSAIGSENIGRANKGAAKALMARTLLYESSYAKYYPGDERFQGMTERWADVLDYAEQVINSGEYELLGANGGRFNTWRNPSTNAYRALFTSNYDNCSESIYEIQDIIDGKGWAAARGNAICQYSAARRVMVDGSPTNSGYWGLDLPADGLVNEFEPGDPRLRAGIAIEGNGDSIEVAGGFRYLISYDCSVTKTYNTKYESSAAEFKDVPNTPWHAAPMNIKLIRYADVLLIAAEAAVELGQNDKALDYINQIRTRARLCGSEGNTVPADLLGTVTLDDIIHERRVELYLEGHRYFDLVRWNLATEYLNHYTEDGYQVIYEDPKHRFMPLPQEELNVNPNLEQYPGW